MASQQRLSMCRWWERSIQAGVPSRISPFAGVVSHEPETFRKSRRLLNSLEELEVVMAVTFRVQALAASQGLPAQVCDVSVFWESAPAARVQPHHVPWVLLFLRPSYPMTAMGHQP